MLITLRSSAKIAYAPSIGVLNVHIPHNAYRVGVLMTKPKASALVHLLACIRGVLK